MRTARATSRTRQTTAKTANFQAEEGKAPRNFMTRPPRSEWMYPPIDGDELDGADGLPRIP